MDDIDERLLAEITENARLPVRQAAEEAGVSRETADYRFKKLNRFIRGYKARPNISRLHHTTYIMFLRLEMWETGREEHSHVLGSEKPEVSKTLADFDPLRFFREAKYPHWIGRASVSWDVLFFFSIREKEQLDSFLDDIFDHFGDNLSDYMLLPVHEEYKDTHSPLFSEGEAVSSYGEDGENSLDDTDKEILRMVCDNCKRSNNEMAEKVGLTDEAVRYRVNRLEENGYILNYRTIFDLEELGYRQFMVNFQFSKMTSGEEEEIESFLKDNDSVLRSGKTLGEYGYYALFWSKNNEEFYEELREVRNRFSGHISDFEVTPVETVEHETVSDALLA